MPGDHASLIIQGPTCFYASNSRRRIRTDTYGGLNSRPLPIGLDGKVCQWSCPALGTQQVRPALHCFIASAFNFTYEM